MRRRIEPKVYASQAAFIDPADCGSMIAYCITSRVRLNASVELSDCNRKISWYFDNENRALKKIDKALEVLADFRRDFVEARKTWRKPRRKRRK